MANTIGVLKNGQLVEEEAASKLLTNPKHDYTKMLLSSAPDIGSIKI